MDSREARLAGWASSAIAGSLVFAIVAFLFIGGLGNIALTVGDADVATLAVAAIFVAYVVSLVCLRKIRRRPSGSSSLLWGVSLITTCIPIIALVSWLGIVAGLVICFLEVIAAVIHIVALSDV